MLHRTSDAAICMFSNLKKDICNKQKVVVMVLLPISDQPKGKWKDKIYLASLVVFPWNHKQ